MFNIADGGFTGIGGEAMGLRATGFLTVGPGSLGGWLFDTNV